MAGTQPLLVAEDPNVKGVREIEEHAPWLAHLARDGAAREVLAEMRVFMPQITEAADSLAGKKDTKVKQVSCSEDGCFKLSDLKAVGFFDSFDAIRRTMWFYREIFCRKGLMSEIYTVAREYARLPSTRQTIQEHQNAFCSFEGHVDLIECVLEPKTAGFSTEFVGEEVDKILTLIHKSDPKRVGLQALALFVFAENACRTMILYFSKDQEKLRMWEDSLSALCQALESEMGMGYPLPSTTLRETSILVRDVMVKVVRRS